MRCKKFCVLVHRFSPVNFSLKVVDKPLKNINFQQKTAELTGSVECVDDSVCGELNVVLRGLEPVKEEYHGTTKGTFRSIREDKNVVFSI